MKKQLLFCIFLLSSFFVFASSLEEKLINAIDSSDFKSVMSYLEQGANPNGSINEPSLISPLGLACNKGDKDTVELLLNRGANPNYKPADNESPFFYTIMGSEKPEILQMLINYGLDVNETTPGQDHNAFMVIVLGHAKVLKILLDSGLDRNIKNKEGYTLSEWANYVGRKDCYDLVVYDTLKKDSESVNLITYDKLVTNLLHSVNDNSKNTIYLNESIFIPKGVLKVIDQSLYYSKKRLLVRFDFLPSYAGPFIIEIDPNEYINISFNNLIYQDLRIHLVGYASYLENKIETQTYRFAIDTREVTNDFTINKNITETDLNSEIETTAPEVIEQNDSTNVNSKNKKNETLNFSIFGGTSFSLKPIIEANVKIWVTPHIFAVMQGGATALNPIAQKISSFPMIPEMTAGIGFNIKPINSYKINIFGYASFGFSFLILTGGWIKDGEYTTISFYPMARGCLGVDFPLNSILLISVQNCFDYIINLGYTDHISVGLTLRIN